MEETVFNDILIELTSFNDLAIGSLENIVSLMDLITYLLMATPVLIILAIVISSINFKDLI